MKKTRSHWMVAFVLAGGMWFASSDFANAAAPISIQIPTQSTDLSDLDVRDSLNRKIAAPAKKNELQNLFAASLTGLVMQNLTPTKRVVKSVLAHSWKVSFGWLQTAAARIVSALVAWVNKTRWHQFFVSHAVTPLLDFNTARRLTSAQTNFHSLIPRLLASTTLLR